MGKPSGICPVCELRGEVGEGCGERGCSHRGYHFVPAAYVEAARSRGRGELDPVVDRLVGDFLVVGAIGAGGFGAVYLALQRPRYRLKAALKLMHAATGDGALGGFLAQNFQNEADALAVLRDPNIVRLLKYGLHGATPYLVMEYVEGGGARCRTRCAGWRCGASGWRRASCWTCCARRRTRWPRPTRWASCTGI